MRMNFDEELLWGSCLGMRSMITVATTDPEVFR